MINKRSDFSTIRPTLTVNCSLYMKHSIKEYCDTNSISQSEFLRMTVDEYFTRVGFVPSPLPRNAKFAACVNNREKYSGAEYAPIKEYGRARKMDQNSITKMCRIKYLFGEAGIPDDEVIHRSSDKLLIKLRDANVGTMGKKSGAYIRWYQSYLRDRMGAVGDDLHCEKEATA